MFTFAPSTQAVMKKILLSFILFLSGMGFLSAQKFAYVDTQYILENLPDYKSAQQQLDRISIQWQKEIEAKFAEIDKMYKDFQAEAILLSDDMKKKREDEIIDKEKAAKEKVAKEKEAKEKAEAEQKREEERKKQEEERLKAAQKARMDELFAKAKAGEGKGSGGGEGNTKPGGNQGHVDGTPGAPHGSVPGSGNSGISFNLSGRKMMSPPRITDNSQETGKVVVDIVVDKYGKVVRATPGARGSTTTSTYLYKLAQNAAIETKFDANPNASVQQNGSMTFVFVLE
jgi:outer membrane protein